MSEALQDPHQAADGLSDATRRLERALLQLEATLKGDRRRGDQDLFARDRLAMAAELDAARTRNRELETAAVAASAALGRAADAVRATLAENAEPSLDPDMDPLDPVDPELATHALADQELAGHALADQDPDAHDQESQGVADEAPRATSGGAGPSSPSEADDPDIDKTKKIDEDPRS